jgi:hypothetical protein
METDQLFDDKVDMKFEEKIRSNSVVEDGTDLEDDFKPAKQTRCSCMNRLSPLFILWFLVLCQVLFCFALALFCF